MSHSTLDLPWLPPAAPDFASACRALPGDGSDLGATLQRLATARLTGSQPLLLTRAIKRSRAAGLSLAPLADLRLGVVSNATFDMIADGLPAAAARHGVALDVMTTDYGQVVQQALDPGSEINAAALDAVLVAVDHRWLGLDAPRLGGDHTARIDDWIAQLGAVVAAFRQNGGTAAILQTVPVPPFALFGNFDRRVSGSVRAMIEEVNRRIVALAADSGSYLLDVAALAERIGSDAWFDPVKWAAYKLPFAAACDAAYCDFLGRLLGAIRGKVRKCLVLDLDNTVWGGVIGDDGMDGIVIGQGSPAGEAFLAVQQYALELRERGIILAVSSKNFDETARRVFAEHPEMLLRENHISVFQANWTDKASNLEAIAKTLNIGVDALVMLDDNPAERAQLRAALPMVAIPELPADPSWYPWYLASAGYFDAVAYSAEDRLRAESYAADAQRAQVQGSARDFGDYLTSLHMTLAATPFDSQGRQRITQLINKTNQFNLTTRRYSEAEVAAFEGDADTFTLQVRLADRFSDLGMIGVVIACPAAADVPTWRIDTWLMSCRVLNRKVEEAMLDALVRAAQAAGIVRIVGTYRPTAKNGMVADFYPRLGFAAAGEDGADRHFTFDVASYEAPSLPFNA